MVSDPFTSFSGPGIPGKAPTAKSLPTPGTPGKAPMVTPGKAPMVDQLAGSSSPAPPPPPPMGMNSGLPPPPTITAAPMVPPFAPPSPRGPAMPPGFSTPGLPGLRPNPHQQQPSILVGGMWIPVHPQSPQQAPPPPPPRQEANFSQAPRPPSPGRPSSPVVRRAPPATFNPGPYVPPPWKDPGRRAEAPWMAGGSYRPGGGAYRPRNVDMARRMPISGLRVPSQIITGTPFFGGRTPDEFLVPHSNPFKALENMGPRVPNRSMPPNVFQHPKTRNPPPHQRPALDHPLSLAGAADPPNIYGHDALANVPEFPARWVDPQPIIDFFSLAAPQVPAFQERPVATTIKNLGSELGIILSPEGPEWRVQEVLPRGPAAQSGSVYVGDIIKSVNGTPLRGLSERSVASAVGGPAETQAVLQVQKQSQNSRDIHTVFLKRQQAEGVQEKAGGVQEPAPYAYEPATMRRDNEAVKEIYPQGLRSQGVLECQILEARNMPSLDLLGLPPDLFVEVISQGQTKKTSTQYKTTDPKWGEILSVPIFYPEEVRAKYNMTLSDELAIQAKSPKMLGGDYTLGTVTFPLSELMRGLQQSGVGEGWYELQRYATQDEFEVVKGQNGEASQLYIRLELKKVCVLVWKKVWKNSPHQ